MTTPLNTATDTITIAAVIPTWNAAPYIERTINSVLNQTRPADEIIVVDDGSTDKTREIVAQFKGQIHYIYQENRGASAARNTGIRAARSNWIAFLDGDDEWTNDKLQQQETAIKNHPHRAWHMGNYLLCSCSKNRQALGHDPVMVNRTLDRPEGFSSYFYAYQHGIFSCMDAFIVKKSVLEELGGFKEDQPRYNDLELWFRIAYRYPEIGFTNQPLGIYHLDVCQSVTRTYQDQTIFYKFLEHHIRLALHQNQLDQLAPCIRFMLTSRMRGMIFRNDTANIRYILKHYRPYLTRRFAHISRMAILWPWLTSKICTLLSWFNRTFKVRPQIIRSQNNNPQPVSQTKYPATDSR